LEAVAKVLATGSTSFRGQVLTALGRWETPRAAEVILAQYPRLEPELQPLAIDLLLQRQTWTRQLLNAVLDKKLPRGTLNANHLRKILDGNDREAIWAVEKAFGTIRSERNPAREQVVAEMGKLLRQQPGDPRSGARVFQKVCAQCHTIYGEGASVGPDLTTNGRASFEQLLSNVFDPSLIIGPGYQAVTVATNDGRSLTGLIVEDNDQRLVLKLPGGGQQTLPRTNVSFTAASKLSMMPEGIENLLERRELVDLFAFLALDRPPADPQARPIPGAPGRDVEARMQIDKGDRKLVVRAHLPGKTEWVELLTYRTDPTQRPYLHPLRDASGHTVLTQDRPVDHPWQHGIFTGFHRVNGFNYWKEDEGRQRFVRLLDLQEESDRASWRSLTELVAPDGHTVLEEEQAIIVYAPESPDAYRIDFKLLLRAKDHDVKFGQFGVGGLAVRMPWEKTSPPAVHLNANGLHGRDCEQKRSAWCSVERQFGSQVYGIAVFDHPSNQNHPSGWRVDEQGLINPAISLTGDWTLAARKERQYCYRLLVHRGPADAVMLGRQFQIFAANPTPGKPPAVPARDGEPR
jgi:putative heme-binding domain-containing protein